MKYCHICETEKPLDDFPVDKRKLDGHTSPCRPCHRKRTNAKNAIKRLNTIDLLGGKCVRCGIDDERVLQVDHVGGGGNSERKSLSSYMMHTKISKSTEGYQLLCANCHCIKTREEDGYSTRARIEL